MFLIAPDDDILHNIMLLGGNEDLVHDAGPEYAREGIASRRSLASYYEVVALGSPKSIQ